MAKQQIDNFHEYIHKRESSWEIINPMNFRQNNFDDILLNTSQDLDNSKHNDSNLL